MSSIFQRIQWRSAARTASRSRALIILLATVIPIMAISWFSSREQQAEIESRVDSSSPHPPAPKSMANENESRHSEERIAPVEKTAPEEKTAEEKVPDASRLVGKWYLDDAIQREIEIRPDGTATMHVTLDFLSSLLYGRNLTLNLKWKLDDDRLVQTVTGGTPAENVEKITKAFGKSLSYEVVEVDSKQLVLKGPSGSKSLENWVARPNEME
jgi:hypothetical protein